MEFTKADETTIQLVQYPVVIQPEPVVYDLDSLREKEFNLLKTRNELIANGDKELADVRAIIATCEAMGLRSKKVVEAEIAQAKAVEDARLAQLKAEEDAKIAMETAAAEVAKREAELQALQKATATEQAVSDTLVTQVEAPISTVETPII